MLESQHQEIDSPRSITLCATTSQLEECMQKEVSLICENIRTKGCREREDAMKDLTRNEEDQVYMSCLDARNHDGEQTTQKRLIEDHDFRVSMELVKQKKSVSKAATSDEQGLIHSQSLLQEIEQLKQCNSLQSQASSSQSCSAAQTSEQQLSQTSYPDTQLSRDSDNRYMCSFCDRRFKTKHGRDGHERSHITAVPKHRCDVENCGKFFLSKENLHRHIRTVSRP